MKGQFVLWLVVFAAYVSLAAAESRQAATTDAYRSDCTRVPDCFHSALIVRAELPGHDKVVCLTFDDGPNPGTTERILDILKQHNAKATFFLVGRNVALFPKLARQIADEGHSIGNHSFTHAKSLDLPQAQLELLKTNRIIKQAAGIDTHIFRPPYGLRQSALANAARNQKFAIVLWSISSADTAKIDSKMIEHNILHTPYPGDIILMHDGGGHHASTVKALPGILKGIEKLGYRCVTVPELLQMWEQERRVLANTRRVAQKPHA